MTLMARFGAMAAAGFLGSVTLIVLFATGVVPDVFPVVLASAGVLIFGYLLVLAYRGRSLSDADVYEKAGQRSAENPRN